MPRSARDEYIVILDFLPRGKPTDRRPEPIAQGIGEKYFNLLEVVLKPGVDVKPKERVYIGEGKRDKVKYIKGRVKYRDLTSIAKDNLEEILEELIKKEEERLVRIFNFAGPITTRKHSLELLPGIGKKHLWGIIDQRNVKPFTSFEDLQKRVDMMPDPVKMIKRRIIEELDEKDEYKLFVGVQM